MICDKTFERGLFDWLTHVVCDGVSEYLAGWGVYASDYQEPEEIKPGCLMIAAGTSQPRLQNSGTVREFNAVCTVILLSPVTDKHNTEEFANARDRVTLAGMDLIRLLYQEEENNLVGFTCAAQPENDLPRSFVNYKGEPWAIANLAIIANEMRLGTRSRQDFVNR